MKDLKLEELLRYGLSGTPLLLVLLLMHPTWEKEIGSAMGVGGTAGLIGMVLVAGSLIYALHRAVAYRMVSMVAICVLVCLRVYKWDLKIVLPLVPADYELAMDNWKLKSCQMGNPVNLFIAEWGSQVHLLYCSAWAILLGVTLGSILPNCQSVVHVWTFYATSFVLAFAAFWHNLRLLWWIKISSNSPDGASQQGDLSAQVAMPIKLKVDATAKVVQPTQEDIQ